MSNLINLITLWLLMMTLGLRRKQKWIFLKNQTKKKGLFATAYTWQNNQRAQYTQYNLFNWTRNYIKKNNLKIRDK